MSDESRRPSGPEHREPEPVEATSIPPHVAPRADPGSVVAARPFDAATVVLVRPAADGLEVLLTRRPETMAFAPGRYVFPGGSVHGADTDATMFARSDVAAAAAAERLGGGELPERALAFHVAALRELFEETGVVLGGSGAIVDGPARNEFAAGRRSFAGTLDDLGVGLRASALVPIARWVTPRFMARRFDTWFFATAVEIADDLAFDPDEVAEATWVTPRTALRELGDGRMPMWPPTIATLQRLARITDPRELEGLRVGRAAPVRVDRLRREIVRFGFAAAGGVPGQAGTGFLVGDRELVLVDPGDPGEDAREAILAAARDAADGDVASTPREIRAIVLSSAEPEQSGGCESLRGELRVPVFGPPGAGRIIASELIELGDGDLVPFGDVALRVDVVTAESGVASLRLAGDGFVLPG